MTGPAVATLSVITFLAFWNDYLWPTGHLPAELHAATGAPAAAGPVQTTDDYGLVLAGAVVAAIPVLLFYLLAQRHIVQSVTSSGVKG